MSDEDNGRFNALSASHDQVKQRLRQLGIGDGATILPGAEAFAPRTDERRLAEKNQARILARDARAKAYAARIRAEVVARDGRVDCRTATADAAQQRIRQLGISTAGLEPLRDARPPPPPATPEESPAAIDSKIEQAARELLRLEHSGVRGDAREITDQRVFRRYVALKFSPAGFPVL
jgi:hypothetical protein